MYTNNKELDWLAYTSISGEIMFFYNFKTGEHRWPTNSTFSGKTVLVRSSDVPPKPIERYSTGTQTEDFGCANHCTSVYIDNERQMENQVSQAIEKNEEVSNDDDTIGVTEQNMLNSTDVNYGPDVASDDAEIDESLITMVKLNRKTGIIQNIRPKKKRGLTIRDCPYCGKTFKRRSHREAHVRTHTGEKPYGCSLCDKAFTHKNNLQVHLRRHSGEKPYECPHCDKAFVQKCGLDVHVRTHTGEKPYKCSSCDKAFSTKSHLSIHERTHTGDKPYECSYCHKAFAQKGDLVVHIRIHTGEKPYKCSHCGKGFPLRTKLNLHLRTHARKNKLRECPE